MAGVEVARAGERAGGGRVGGNSPAVHNGVAQTAGVAGRGCCFCLDVCGAERTAGAGPRGNRPSATDSSSVPEVVASPDRQLPVNGGGVAVVQGGRAGRGCGDSGGAELRTSVENILAIRRNKRLSAAFNEWSRLEKDNKHKVDDGEKVKTELVTQVFNIVGFFSVFQGVVLTAVSQLNSQNKPQCGKIWVPIVLSVIAAVVSIVALLVKYLCIKDAEETIREKRRIWQGYSKILLKLRNEGAKFEIISAELPIAEGSESWRIFWFKKIAVLVALLFFTGIFILSYFVILCDKWEIGGWN